MELPQQQQDIAPILGQAGDQGIRPANSYPLVSYGNGFNVDPSRMDARERESYMASFLPSREQLASSGTGLPFADRFAPQLTMPTQRPAVSPSILGQAGGGQGFAVSPSILEQIPGIQNITLGQAPIVSQEGIQYQTPDVFSSIGLGSARGVTQREVSRPEQIIPAGRFGGQSEARITDLSPSKVQGRGRIVPSGYGAQAVPEATVPAKTDQLLGQLTPTIQSIAEVEQAREQALQPEATFTLPSGEVRSIMPGQDVASAFGRENNGLMTFQVDGGEVTVPSAQAIQTMNLGEQAAARQAQQEFLASPAAREMSNRMLQSVMNDPYAQASREREARLAAKPDFMRAVSDRERRGTGEMSMASATKLTGGDRDKARAMIELQRQGRDPMTGKEVEAPFEPKEIEISGNKYIQLTPNYFQPVKQEAPEKTEKSEIQKIRDAGAEAGLPENLIRQSIASKLGLDIYDEGVANWMAGNTDIMPSVEGVSESSTFDPTSLTGQDKEAYDWAMANPSSPQSAQILARLSK